MKKIYFLMVSILILTYGLTNAQPTQPANPPAGNSANCTVTGTSGPLDVCPTGSTTFVTNFQGGVYNRGNNGNNLGLNAVWRFSNIGTIGGVTINAEVTINAISNSILTNMDDNSGLDQAGNSVADFFAPVISPDVSLNLTDRRGYVQFTVNFFQGTANFTNPITINNLNLVSYDADGSFEPGGATSQAWLRETRVAQAYTTSNPQINANGGTELVGYIYTDPAATTWRGFAGGVYERTGISRCAEVASSFRYGTGANGRSSITIRFGYDFKAGTNGYNIGQPGRQYGSRFGCYTFPQPGPPLPVLLQSFTASRNQQSANVGLKWTSSAEINNVGFEIQRNLGNDNWQTIGFVNSLAPGGNSVSDINYSYDDFNNSKTVSQYRLRQVDIDAKMKYSEIRSVRGLDQKGGIIIYPNPTNDGKVNIVFEDKNSVRDISVMDISGRMVKQMKNITANSIQIDNLTPGMYSIKVLVPETGEQTVEKIVVNKR